MSVVDEVPIQIPHPALPDGDWADAYQVEVLNPFPTAREAGYAIVRAFPKWTYPALAARQVLVAPFGLKGAGSSVEEASDRLGIFPIIDDARDRLIAGIDDKHLDFRIVIDLAPTSNGQIVTLTTVIKRHNALGRFYLQTVLPFHRAIIKGALTEMAQATSLQ